MCHVIYGFESAKLKIILNLFTWVINNVRVKRHGKLKQINKKWRPHRNEASTYLLLGKIQRNYVTKTNLVPELHYFKLPGSIPLVLAGANFKD